MTSRSVHHIWFARLALLLGVVSILGCEPEPPKPRQAILFMLDAARPDRFSCYGYHRTTTPEMDRLAGQGVLFSKHFAQGTYTRASVSSLLYSRYFCKPLFPSSTQVPYSSPSNLFRRRKQRFRRGGWSC